MRVLGGEAEMVLDVKKTTSTTTTHKAPLTLVP